MVVGAGTPHIQENKIVSILSIEAVIILFFGQCSLLKCKDSSSLCKRLLFKINHQKISLALTLSFIFPPEYQGESQEQSSIGQGLLS